MSESGPSSGACGTVGVYVHVPFCERVCPYCDFAVVAARVLAPEQEGRYVAAVLRELDRRAPAYAGRRLASLYLGGGTPSLLTPESVARIVEAVRKAFPPVGAQASAPVSGQAPAPVNRQASAPVGGLEVTLEVNPSTVERERLPGFRAAGVGRLSVGVQSFDDTTLRRLGRAHRAQEGRRTLEAARAAGFDNLSLDLIVAAPGQAQAELERELDEAIAFAPEHVSAYELTLEPATPFGRAAARGKLVRPGEDAIARMLERVAERLGAAGLPRYEVSSYARPGFASRHNRRYWEREPVLGIGMGAWSLEPPRPEAPHGTRRANARDLRSYLERVEADASAVSEAEVLDARTARAEAAFLALRQCEGLAAARFAAEFGAPPRAFFGEAIDALTSAGLLEESSAGDLRPTPRGLLLADAVAERFV